MVEVQTFRKVHQLIFLVCDKGKRDHLFVSIHPTSVVVPPPVTDVEDVDNEKREMNEGDMASLHQFYSKHLDFPDQKELLSIFSQVRRT